MNDGMYGYDSFIRCQPALTNGFPLPLDIPLEDIVHYLVSGREPRFSFFCAVFSLRIEHCSFPSPAYVV